jgi:peptide/nickel transport system substrate-binding protein
VTSEPDTRVSRRTALKSFALGAWATLLTACASPPQASRPPATVAAAAAQPRSGGTLRIGVLGDIPSLDPHQLTPPVPDVTYSVWDRLMEYDAGVKPRPVLAESWDMSADGKQLKLTLRQGVQFHTGREFTSEDVKWTLTRLQTEPVVAVTGFYTQIQPLSSVDAVDKYTVVLKSDAPWPGVFDLLSLMSVVDSATMQGPNAKTQAVGTGPFTFGEWVQGDHVRLVKNQHYWADGHPYVDELYFQIYKDPQAMVTALEAGTIDLANKPPLLDAVRLQKDRKFQVMIAETGGTRYSMLFNVLARPTDNQQFRQAMLYAIDRQRIVDTVLQGVGAACDLPFATSSPAYDATKDHYYTFDLDKARSLVSSSGVSEPALDFNYTVVSAEWAGIAQVYQADLAKVGVKLNLKPVDPVTLNTELRGRTFTGVMTGTVPLGAVSPTQQAFNPYYSPLVSFSGFKSDTLTRLADGLQHEVDPAKQTQVYAQWRDYVLDQAWAGQIATSPPLAAMSPGLHGPKYTQTEMLDYRDVWLDPR